MKIIQKVILFLTGLSAIAVAILKFTGDLDSITWLKQDLNGLILVCLGIVMLSIVYERHYILEKLKEDFEGHLSTTKDDFSYLRNTSETKEELVELAENSRLYIFSIGSKTQIIDYLSKIVSKVKKSNLQYNRLLTGDHITHELHRHLASVIDQPNVRIKWIENEKYGNMTVSENTVVIALPSPESTKFTGIGISNLQDVKFYNLYFNRAFDNAKNTIILNKDQLSVLCEKCGENTAKNIDKIKNELKKYES